MVHYHFYVEAGALIDATAKIYKVAVGATKQATRDFLYLTAHAVDHGHFFHLVDAATSDFILRLTKSVEGVTLNIQSITARNLVRELKAATAVPLSAVQLHQLHNFHNVMDVDYRVFSNLNRR